MFTVRENLAPSSCCVVPGKARFVRGAIRPGTSRSIHRWKLLQFSHFVANVRADLMVASVSSRYSRFYLFGVFTAAWRLGFLVSWLLGCLASWFLGCLAAWLPGCLCINCAASFCIVSNLYISLSDFRLARSLLGWLAAGWLAVGSWLLLVQLFAGWLAAGSWLFLV